MTPITTITLLALAAAGAGGLALGPFGDAPPEPRLSVSLQPTGHRTARAGRSIVWTATVRNDGPGEAARVRLHVAAPTGARLLRARPSAGRCGKGPATVCHLGSLPARRRVTVRLVLRLEHEADATLSARVASG